MKRVITSYIISLSCIIMMMGFYNGLPILTATLIRLDCVKKSLIRAD